jgi:putative redox protein
MPVVMINARMDRRSLRLSFGRAAFGGSFFLLTTNDLRFNWRKFRQNLLQLMTSTVIYEGELRTVATHLQSGTKIETDAPTDNQGKGERFSPTDLLATAVGACMATTMGIKARDMEVDLRGMKLSVQKIMKSDPRRVAGVNVIFDFPAGFQADEKQKAILERTAHTCPVAISLHPDIEIKVEFHWSPVMAPQT